MKRVAAASGCITVGICLSQARCLYRLSPRYPDVVFCARLFNGLRKPLGAVYVGRAFRPSRVAVYTPTSYNTSADSGL